MEDHNPCLFIQTNPTETKLPCDEVVSPLKVYDQVNLDKPGMFVSSRKKTVPFPGILQHTRQEDF